MGSALPGRPPSAGDARWWRGNLHTHSLWSDGDDFPEMIAEWYRAHGYHFLAFSDHNVLSQGQRWTPVSALNQRAGTNAFGKYLERYGSGWVETRTASSGGTEVRLKPFDEYRAQVEERGRFLMIQSEEITHEARNGRAIHMNATNLAELILPRDSATVRDVIASNVKAVEESAARTGRNLLLQVNHPNYKWGVTAEDLAAVPGIRLFEVWNGVADDNDPGEGIRPSTEEIWDIANTLRITAGVPPLFGLATDDAHNYHGNNPRAVPGRAWVMVRAPALSPDSLARAIRAGDFYSSTGVLLDEITLSKDSRRLSLRIQPHQGERFVTRFVGTRKGANIVGRPRLDKQGRPLETTLDYRTSSGPQVGEVLAKAEGLTPGYTLRGDELYVRAVVTSSGAPDVPSTESSFKRAWTQPVGC